MEENLSKVYFLNPVPETLYKYSVYSDPKALDAQIFDIFEREVKRFDETGKLYWNNKYEMAHAHHKLMTWEACCYSIVTSLIIFTRVCYQDVLWVQREFSNLCGYDPHNSLDNGE